MLVCREVTCKELRLLSDADIGKCIIASSPTVNTVFTDISHLDPEALLTANQRSEGLFGTLQYWLDIIGDEMMPSLDNVSRADIECASVPQHRASMPDAEPIHPSPISDTVEEVSNTLNLKPRVKSLPRRDSAVDL
jgi:hypothetical protein